mgnify:CR=1 FL=1|jgi:hypothetical protein
MNDYLITVVVIVILRTIISPIGAFVRWIYNSRDKPLSFYIKEDGNQNSGIAVFTLVAIFTLVYFTVNYFLNP